MIEIAILVISVLVSTVTGLVVVVRNPRHIINRVYGILTTALILFSIANYFSLETTDRLFFIRAVIFLSTIIVASLYYLVLVLDKDYKHFTVWQRRGLYITGAVAALDFTPLVFSGLTESSNPVPVPSVAAPIFAVHLITFLALGVGLLLFRLRKIKGLPRLQHIYLLIGILPMFLFAPVTGFVMPVIFQNASLIMLSPIYGAIFVMSIGYAIVRHKLFDVRLVVARSLAYLLTLSLIATIYGFLAFLVSRYVFDLKLSLITQIVLALSTGLSVLVFHQFKTYFDKVTNRLFYRDAYDPQALFDEYNRALVSTIDLDVLLKRTTEVIRKYLQTDFCVVGVNTPSMQGYRVLGVSNSPIDPAHLAYIDNVSPHLHRLTVVRDDMPYSDSPLRQVLDQNNISVVIRLSNKLQSVQQDIGYLVLGAKKSGNLYTKQDINMLESLANELVIALQNALRFEEIERFNETLQQKVADATRQLRESNKKLKQLNESKDDFIGMASHQLRTPLTSVKGYISLVIDGDAGAINDMQRNLLKQAFNSSQKMVYLVADLLNVSRLKTGKFIIERKPTNLARMLEDESAQLKEEASSRGLELTIHAPADFPTLPLDDTKTRQVVMNFLDNAIYYTPSGGHIQAELKELPESIEFRVTDDGIGVPKSERHHLFTKFYRAKNAQRARPDGTGLGLYMAQKVVLAQGGATIFDSTEGKGSTFGFTFPKYMDTSQDSQVAAAVAKS